MLPTKLLPNNFFFTQRSQIFPFLKTKLRSINSFEKKLNFLKKISFQSNRLFGTKSNKVYTTQKRILKKLASWGTLFFFIVFLLYPAFYKIAGVSPALASKFSKKNVFQKLSQVPVFAVTNPTGQPYLANNSNGEQIGLIFFSKEDALNMLKSMQKTHAALETRVYIMGLDKAYRMVTLNASPSGIRENFGQELKMIFRFYADQKQIKNANVLEKNLNPIKNFNGIPVFIADGLTIRKGKEEIIPIFLSKEDLEESWSTMCRHNPDQPIKPKIQVSSLLELILKMEKHPKDFESFGFFPPSESLKFVKSENTNNPSARLIPGGFQKI